MPTQTVTIAQALASSSTNLLVLDTAANIAAALPNPALVARCASFSLSAAALINTAAADKLAALGVKFTPGTTAIAVQDSVAAMTAPANAAGLALATSREIIDAAYNLLAAPAAAFLHIASVTLTGTPTLSMAQLGKLEGLPGFTYAPTAHPVFQDALAAFVPVLSAHPGWFATASALSVRLDGSQIGAAGVAALAALANGGKTVTFVAGQTDTTLNVTDTAHNLAAAAAALNLFAAHTALHLTISNDGSAVNSADAVALLSINGFTAAAHTLYVADTGAAITANAATLFSHAFPEILVTSGNFTGTAVELLSPALHLQGNATVTMTGTPTVTAQQIQTLAALPGFALANGATLTVSDSVSQLIAHAASLGAATAVAVADSETVTAANAASLAQIAAAHAGHFSLGGHTLTVADTPAALLALPGPAQALATALTLSANATVTAAQAGQLALLAHYGNGGFALTVMDGAAAIVANEPAILQIATTAVVDDTGPLSASQADTLALLAAANKLVFQGGDQLNVADSYAALIANANASGVALANSLTVVDTAANLVAAAGHNWGNKVPTYVLSGSAVLTGAQATTLAGLGVHFQTGDATLSVLDTAAGVLGAAAALTTLGIRAAVVDSAANIGADLAQLQGLGAVLASVQANDVTPVSGAVAAALAPLAAKLTGPALPVLDNAAGIDGNLAALHALGAHVAITVHDSAALIGSDETDFSTLGSALTVSLTDVAPVSASTAASLWLLAARMAPGTALAVTDTAAAIAGVSTLLAALSGSLGTITLQGGNTVSAAQAAALLPLQAHLGLGVALTVADSGAAIAANVAQILQLQGDGRIAAVTDAGDTAAGAAGAITALNAVGAHVTIADTLAQIGAEMAFLAQLTGLSAVTVTDVLHPAFALSLSQYVADRPVLAVVTNTHSIAITDSAAAIAADLGSATPVLTGISGTLTIATTGNATLVVPEAVALAPAVTAILGDLVSPLQITGVDLAHLAAALALLPVSVTVSDSAADIQADLASGHSAIVADIAAIASIAATGGGPITLTAAQALAAHVDDGPGSVFGLLSGAALAVTGASVAQAASLLLAQVPPASIAVSDTAAAIEAALTNPASPLLAAAATILSITVNNAQPVVLSAAQDLAAGVNDSAHAALTKLAGTLDVTNVSIAQLGAVEDTARLPDLVQVSDTGSAIAGALAALLQDLPNLGAIMLTAGVVTLTAAQAMLAHVADGAGSLVSLLPGHAYTVAGASLSQVAALVALAQPPASIAVTDSSATLAADLSAVQSVWAAHVNSVTVTGGVLTLTDAQADAIVAALRQSDLEALTGGQIVDVTGVPVSDLLAVGGLAADLGQGVTLQIEVRDSALALALDALANTPVLTQEAAYVHSVTLTAAGGTLTPAQLSAVAAISGLNANGVTVPVSGLAAAVAGLSVEARALAAGSVTVIDNASDVVGALSALQAAYSGALSITLTGVSPGFTVSAASYVADQATIDAITNSGVVTVDGSAAQIAAIESQLAADPRVGSVQISDTGFNVVSNLAAIAALGTLATVTLTDVGSISASVAGALAQQGLAHLVVGNLVVADTGSQLAALAEGGGAGLAFLIAQGAQLSVTSNVALLDAEALAGLGNAFSLHGNLLNVWDTAAHLTQPGAAAALATLVGDSLVNAIYLKTSGGAVTLSAASAVALLAIPGLIVNNPDNSANAITVADSAAHLDANFAALESDAPAIAHIVVNASATVGFSTLSDLQALGAVAAGGVALTLADDAANIITAAGQSGTSVQAAAYVLDASAVISGASALALAALPNFSAGAYTLTASLGANTPVTVAQANALAGLGAALVVTGHEFTITGTAAALAGLTASGAAVAHVALADTLADVAGLAATSPLLTGSITITDSEALSAAQAGAFLALMQASGVNLGSVSFGGHVETVTDSVAALRALTASAAWTGDAALQPHFALVASDTAANLSNPANAAFIDGLSGAVLSATSSVNAATAAALAGLHGISLGGNGLIVSDSAANLLAPANSAGLALATSVTLNGAASLNTAGAETLLELSNFHLTQPLSITDTSANLLDGTLSGLIAGHGQVQVALAGPETLDAQTAAALVALQGFADTTDMHIVDSSSYLLAPGASAAEAMAVSVSLDGNETVSANTILRLSEVPHFTTGGAILSLASNDFANAPTLQAIADLGGNFTENGHSLSLTQDDLALTPTEYAAIQTDGFVANGHVISAVLVTSGNTDSGNLLSVSATGIAGADVNVYGATGAPISTTHEANASFTITAPDTGTSYGFSITETVAGVESAPVVVLDQAALENAVSQLSASFASSGQIQVDSGKYINLYTLGAQLPNAPALVYDPAHHTISLDIPNSAPVTLITLGASTSPASIDPSEILVKHHS
jgi:hypothetical protein